MELGKHDVGSRGAWEVLMYIRAQMGRALTLDKLAQYLLTELNAIEQAFNTSSITQLEPLAVEPEKPRDGMIIYADGVSWNPGFGEGFYGREAGVWVKL